MLLIRLFSLKKSKEHAPARKSFYFIFFIPFFFSMKKNVKTFVLWKSSGSQFFVVSFIIWCKEFISKTTDLNFGHYKR